MLATSRDAPSGTVPAGATPTSDRARLSAASTLTIRSTHADALVTSAIASVVTPQRSSDGKEHRFVLALQVDVEAQGVAVGRGQ